MTPTCRETPGDRDLRRWILSRRLLLHRARTRTVYDFTGITRHPLARLRRRWQILDHDRHRGPSPSSFTIFFRSAQTREIASCAALICQFHDLLTPRLLSAKSRLSERLDVGERVCDAFEAFSACCPGHDFELEQFLLLARGIVRQREIALGGCTNCGGALLMDLLAAQSPTCRQCHASSSSRHNGVSDGNPIPAFLPEGSSDQLKLL